MAFKNSSKVATALTVYGIETKQAVQAATGKLVMLQQHLPFTVLKRSIRWW